MVEAKAQRNCTGLPVRTYTHTHADAVRQASLPQASPRQAEAQDVHPSVRQRAA